MIEMFNGDCYSIDEFCDMLDDTVITEYDGIGYYIYCDGITYIESNNFVDFDSDTVKRVAKEYGYVGVKWYNK